MSRILSTFCPSRRSSPGAAAVSLLEAIVRPFLPFLLMTTRDLRFKALGIPRAYYAPYPAAITASSALACLPPRGWPPPLNRHLHRIRRHHALELHPLGSHVFPARAQDAVQRHVVVHRVVVVNAQPLYAR